MPWNKTLLTVSTTLWGEVISTLSVAQGVIYRLANLPRRNGHRAVIYHPASSIAGGPRLILTWTG